MNKRWAFLCLFLLHCALSAQEQPSIVALFKKYSDNYVIEPSWAIATFLSMDKDQFIESWSFFVDKMMHNPERLIAACEHKYSERKYRGILIGQCVYYHHLLKNLFVSPSSKAMHYLINRPVPKGLVNVVDYANKNNIVSFQHFYAFYFDRLSADYCESINNAFRNSDHVDYQDYKSKAQRLLSELYSIHFCLQGSALYESCYQAHLKNYQSIFNFLVEHKRSQEQE